LYISLFPLFNSKPRNVLELKRGKSDMYKIIPSKGESFVVNGDHILCLKATKNVDCILRKNMNLFIVTWHEKDEEGYPISLYKHFPFKFDFEDEQIAKRAAQEFYEEKQKSEKFIKQDDIIEIPVREYLKRLNKIGKTNYLGYRLPIDFPEKKINLDPYLLGYWIGNEYSTTSIITINDEKIVKYYQEKIEKLGLSIKKVDSLEKVNIYYIICHNNKNKNLFLKALQDYKLIKNKHIPYVYKCNSRDIRLKVLAGILDSNGYYQSKTKQYELTMKSEKIIDDVIYL
jgi:hypothetical protein